MERNKIMPAYNFKKEFAYLVETGQKLQTIREVRKRKTALGDKIFLYSGMRTKACRLLGMGEIVGVQKFILHSRETFTIADIDIPAMPWKDGLKLARQDGFDTWEEFVKFFEDHYGLPFFGEIIRWRKISRLI